MTRLLGDCYIDGRARAGNAVEIHLAGAFCAACKVNVIPYEAGSMRMVGFSIIALSQDVIRWTHMETGYVMHECGRDDLGAFASAEQFVELTATT